MDEILKIFGEERYRNDLLKARRFWKGEGRYIISVNPVEHNYRQLFDQKRMEVLAGLAGYTLAFIGLALWIFQRQDLSSGS